MFGTKGQINATSTLLKFCEEHGHAPNWISKLKELLILLQNGSRDEFLEKYENFKRAGMGSFIDWFPQKIYEHETDEYIETIWWALVGHWDEQIAYAKKS